MSMTFSCVVTCGALLVGAAVAHAEQSRTLDEERLRTLETRVQALESAAPPAPEAKDKKTTTSAFNPAVSLILNGTYADFSQDPASYALPGFSLAPETGPGERGLSLGESELVMSASIDDKFYGHFTAALTPENEIKIEEAYFETLALGAGFTARAGRFLSHLGYLNSQHPHAWDFADAPLVYRALLGPQYGDDGVQLRWVAPAALLVEFGAELFRGDAFPAGGAAKDGKGARTLFAHLGGDVGASHAWRAGLSYLKAESEARESGDPAAPDLFTGTVKLTGVDFVWKWAPNGNPRQTNAKFQAEYFVADNDGEFDPASSGTPLAYRGKQRGWYAQAVYQFIPQWRVGLRYDRLETDSVDAALAGTALDNAGHAPRRAAAMLDWSGSEYSRLRLQYNRDESRADATDHQWYLQYLMSLGAHGAHAF